MEDAVPTRRRRGDWIRVASDRVPTKWFASIGIVLFLAVTASFGGLATAAEPAGPDEISAGEEHVNDQLAITVQRAVLLDEFPEAGISIEDDERVLAVQVDIRNEWTQPLVASRGSSVAESILIESRTLETLDDAEATSDAQASSFARLDDATVSPWLQPGVDATLVLTWAISPDEYTDGDDLHVALNDMTLYTGSFVAEGQWWIDPIAAAIVTVPIVDLGAGAE
ncbi:hypothetical protein ACWPKO_29545 (plasmid) [Coraliomargarita sp. W4R53]